VAYAIGVADPVSVMIDTFGTGAVPEPVLEAAVREVFDLKPRGIIQALDLLQPIYRRTAAYGHFGRAPEAGRYVDTAVSKEIEYFTWERVNRVEDLRLAVQRATPQTSAQTVA
jgi:S-adenosylmethionine synthetase